MTTPRVTRTAAVLLVRLADETPREVCGYVAGGELWLPVAACRELLSPCPWPRGVNRIKPSQAEASSAQVCRWAEVRLELLKDQAQHDPSTSRRIYTRYSLSLERLSEARVTVAGAPWTRDPSLPLQPYSLEPLSPPPRRAVYRSGLRREVVEARVVWRPATRKVLVPGVDIAVSARQLASLASSEPVYVGGQGDAAHERLWSQGFELLTSRDRVAFEVYASDLARLTMRDLGAQQPPLPERLRDRLADERSRGRSAVSQVWAMTLRADMPAEVLQGAVILTWTWCSAMLGAYSRIASAWVDRDTLTE